MADVARTFGVSYNCITGIIYGKKKPRPTFYNGGMAGLQADVCEEEEGQEAGAMDKAER